MTTIAERPSSFPARNELAPGLRSARHGRYLIFFVAGDVGCRLFACFMVPAISHRPSPPIEEGSMDRPLFEIAATKAGGRSDIPWATHSMKFANLPAAKKGYEQEGA